MQLVPVHRAVLLALAAMAVALLGGCATESEPAQRTSTVVGTVSTFDLATADVDEVAEALQRDGRVVIRGVTFETDSAGLAGDSYASVTKLGTMMNDHPTLNVAVVGHTDNTGAFQYNMDLSQRRAQAIVQALQDDFDVANERLAAVGVGPLAPIDNNTTESGRSQNRRVELVVIG